VLSFDAILANGSLVTVSSCSYPDLFWALRGGGAPSFGVVTSVTVRLQDASNSYTYGLFCLTDRNEITASLRSLGIIDSGTPFPRWLSLQWRFANFPGSTLYGFCYTIFSMRDLNTTLLEVTRLAYVTSNKADWVDLEEFQQFYPMELRNAALKDYTPINTYPDSDRNCLINSLSPEVIGNLTVMFMSMPANCLIQGLAMGGAVADIPADQTAFPWRSSLYNAEADCS